MAINYDLLNISCAVIGALIFLFCITQVHKILKLFPDAKMSKDWKIINILIIFFLMGYIINIVAVILNQNDVLLFMQSFVYLFGALFVMMVIRLSLKTYKIILQSAEEDE